MIYTNLIRLIISMRFDELKYCLFFINNTTHAMEDDLFKIKTLVKDTIFKYIK